MMRVLTVEEMVCVSGGDTFVDLSAGLDSNPDLSVFVLDASGSGGSSASLPGGLIGVGGSVTMSGYADPEGPGGVGVQITEIANSEAQLDTWLLGIGISVVGLLPDLVLASIVAGTAVAVPDIPPLSFKNQVTAGLAKGVATNIQLVGGIDAYAKNNALAASRY